MTTRLRQSLTLIRDRTYKVDRNDRLKLPAEWLYPARDTTMYVYITPDGDLLVSRHDYR